MSEEARRFWDYVDRFRAVAIIVSVYVVGLLPLLVFAVLFEGAGELNSHGDGPGEVWRPYTAAYGFFLGMVFGRWWVALLPAAQLLFITPGPDQAGLVVAAIAGLAIGVVLHRFLVRRASARTKAVN